MLRPCRRGPSTCARDDTFFCGAFYGSRTLRRDTVAAQNSIQIFPAMFEYAHPAAHRIDGFLRNLGLDQFFAIG
jgi:hypothetical protein